VRRFIFPLVALVFAATLVAGCGSNDDDNASSSTSASSSAASADFNDADVAFAQGMIPHHEQAIEMAQLADTRATSPDVEELAARIEEAQGPEIETLQSWLEEWDEPESADEDEGGMDHGDAPDTSDGMMTHDDMTELEGADGAPFDEMFLTMMTEHHRGAIDMAQTEVDEGQNPDAVAMAEKIIADQTAEIDEMNKLLQSA
jgi:uncharacterized protein (DUF305 family)